MQSSESVNEMGVALCSPRLGKTVVLTCAGPGGEPACLLLSGTKLVL